MECWPFFRAIQTTVLKLSEFGGRRGHWSGLTPSDKWIGNKLPNSRDGPLILIKADVKRRSEPHENVNSPVGVNRGSHPATQKHTHTHIYHLHYHIQDAPLYHSLLAASLTSFGSLFSYYLLTTTDTATATLHLSSIPFHAPLVELGWRQRGRSLELNDLVSLRFNGEIRCCRDNGWSMPEVKDNGYCLYRQGSGLQRL